MGMVKNLRINLRTNALFNFLNILQPLVLLSNGQIAQLVEQRTENPCVGGSIPPLATAILLNISMYNR